MLPADHPGVSDPAYQARRAAIAAVGRRYQRGEPIPDVVYVPEEDDVWRTVSAELARLHKDYACEEYQRGAARLALPADRVPQLREVDARVSELTGFRIQPVPGLVATRVFYGALSERHFLSTQYVRHHSVPFYTPEPDIVHELVGHAASLAHPTIAALNRELGRASVGASADDLRRLESFYWFTLEFGLVLEDGAPKALGAGLLSSVAELTRACTGGVELRPFSAAVTRMPFRTDAMQKILFVAPSLAALRSPINSGLRTKARGRRRSSRAW